MFIILAVVVGCSWQPYYNQSKVDKMTRNSNGSLLQQETNYQRVLSGETTTDTKGNNLKMWDLKEYKNLQALVFESGIKSEVANYKVEDK